MLLCSLKFPPVPPLLLPELMSSCIAAGVEAACDCPSWMVNRQKRGLELILGGFWWFKKTDTGMSGRNQRQKACVMCHRSDITAVGKGCRSWG